MCVYFQWDLVCDKLALGPLVGTLYIAGNFVGSVGAGAVADRWAF